MVETHDHFEYLYEYRGKCYEIYAIVKKNNLIRKHTKHHRLQCPRPVPIWLVRILLEPSRYMLQYDQGAHCQER
jgi:hypothetical protein